VFASARHGFAVYSPHTALDAVPLGVNDWLAEGLGAGTTRALVPAAKQEANAKFKLVVFVPKSHVDALRDGLSDAGAGHIGAYSHCSFCSTGEGTFFGHEGTTPALGRAERFERVEEERLEMVCSQASLASLADVILRHHPYEEPAWELYPLAPKPQQHAGSGRLLTLDAEATLGDLVERAKSHLGLERLRVASSDAHRSGARFKRVAVCAGSGRSVFEHAPEADVYLTGELGHHDVLALLARGKSVILAEHSHTERGYLPRLRERLSALTGERVEIELAASDSEPLAWL
jgi:putative NIF3 family GTP cyclohydrolase 1 type 2